MSPDFSALTRRILHLANQGPPRIEFLREISHLLLKFTGCDAFELRVKDGDLHYLWRAQQYPEDFSFERVPGLADGQGRTIPAVSEDSPLERLCRHVLLGQFHPELPFFTKDGSFWTGDTGRPLPLFQERDHNVPEELFRIGGDYQSLALIPFVITEQDGGILIFRSRQREFFNREKVEFYGGVAQTLGIAVADRRAQAALRERVKELSCLYDITLVAQGMDHKLEEILQEMVTLLPPALQYPEHAMAAIVLDGRRYVSADYTESHLKLTAAIRAGGRERGHVEVAYTNDLKIFESDLFLPEECDLLEGVARQVALVIERQQSEGDKLRLQDQLRHADRLATIGQLAAGLAHELNEPLGNILGFAQLAGKAADLPQETREDLRKIVTSALHAREIIKKLLIFARQMPPSKTLVNLNQIVADGLYLLDTRFARKGITLARKLAPNLPEITADPVQLHQVFVNLVVNAVQAMPDGGRLTIATYANEGEVVLAVADTGVGMSEEVMRQIFVPFFTTKDVGEGTGLGLSVVHGIVNAHGGTIQVESAPGRGARFEVHLPVAGTEEDAVV